MGEFHQYKFPCPVWNSGETLWNNWNGFENWKNVRTPLL